jgi:4-amino-4-deoxy-L-arabinose transferase-like glycosyltransferase
VARTLLLIPVLFAGLLVLGGLLGPASSTETRYAEMGREMLESGDWIVPTLNYAPLLEKPPWIYWVTAASYAVFGVNDVTPRIPSLLAAALTLLAIAALVRRSARAAGETAAVARDRGLLAALALATMPSFLVQAYTISIDVWLVLVTTVAGWALLEAERAAGKERLRWTLLLHAMTGFAMIVKGPLTLGLVFGAAALTAALRRDARILRPLLHPLGWLVFAALAAPWYVALDAQIPGMLRSLVERRLFGGVASSADFHDNPPLTVWLPLLGTFPWLATLPASIGALRRAGRWLRGPGLPVLLLALAAPLLFTFAKARLPSYPSPAFPWIAVLVALGAPAPGPAAGTSSPRAGFWSWSRQLSYATVAMAVVAVASVLLGAFGLGVSGAALVVAAACAVAAVLVAVLPRRAAGPWPAAPRAAFAGALMLFTSAAGIVGVPDSVRAAKPLWDAVARVRRPGEEVGVALDYNGDWGLFPWYAREPVRYFNYPSAEMMVDPHPLRPDLFIPMERLQAWFAGPERRFLMTRPRYVRENKGKPGHLGTLPRYVVADSREYLILTNLPLPAEGP